MSRKTAAVFPLRFAFHREPCVTDLESRDQHRTTPVIFFILNPSITPEQRWVTAVSM